MSQVQVQFKGQSKTLSLSSNDVLILESHVRSAFQIAPETPMKIKFVDEDQDFITISFNEELEEAIKSSKTQPLVIIVEVDGLSSQDSFVLVSSSDSKKVEGSNLQDEQQQQPPQYETTQAKEEARSEKQKEKSDEMTAIEGMEVIAEEEAHSSNNNNNNTLNFITNEFHFHRLIVQTAVQSSFQKMRQQPIVHNTIETIREQKEIIVEAISTTLREWRNSMENSPTAQDIANKVSSVLHEAGMMAAPVIAKIRQSIIDILNSILENKNPLTITREEVEQMSEIAAQAGSIEMENLMLSLDKSESKTLDENGEVQVPSALEEEDGFVCVENYRVDDPIGNAREKKASQNSEIVWQRSEESLEKQAVSSSSQEEQKTLPKESENLESESRQEDGETLYKTELETIVSMGFEAEKAQPLLLQFNGNVEQTINALIN